MEKVAKISKLYGADGAAVINLYPSFPETFSTSEPLFVRVDELNVPLWCSTFERRGRSSAVVRFNDIDSERRIMEFMGCELMSAQEDDDTEQINDEFFMEDLVGFSVEVIAPEQLGGTLSDYIHSEVNPLFEVRIDDREVLIPAVEEFIHSIDFEKGIIRFSLPEGLLEL